MGGIYGHNDIPLQITDITAVTYKAAIYKNLVHTSTINAAHNLTSDYKSVLSETQSPYFSRGCCTNIVLQSYF